MDRVDQIDARCQIIYRFKNKKKNFELNSIMYKVTNVAISELE